MSEYLTVREAAVLLGCTPQAVRKACKEGRLGHRRRLLPQEQFMYEIPLTEIDRLRTEQAGFVAPNNDTLDPIRMTRRAK